MECQATARTGCAQGGHSERRSPQAAYLASHDPPLDRDASVAVRFGHRLGRAVAWAREPNHFASLYRGRPGDEGTRARPAAGAKDKNASLPCFGLLARVPEVPLICAAEVASAACL